MDSSYREHAVGTKIDPYKNPNVKRFSLIQRNKRCTKDPTEI